MNKQNKNPKIFIIAGEASGDWLGHKIMRELKDLQPKAEITGIGGKNMEGEGLKSLFPITELSLMGFAEVLPHIPRLKRRIRQTVAKIEKVQPDILITIDSPGFNFRVVKQLQDLRKKGTKIIHYVAPTVWAYKPERAKTTAELYDALLTILPFEPEFFVGEGLRAEFVGHPVIEDGLDKGDADAFRKRHEIVGDFLCFMPGSRKGELKKMLPVFSKISKQMEMRAVILAANNTKFILEAACKGWELKPLIVDVAEKSDCFAASSGGVIKSGTAGLEYAFAGKPYVVTYKVNPLSAYMLRKMIRVSYVNLINILLEKEAVPELLQEECDAEYISDNLKEVMSAPGEQIAECQKALNMLRAESEFPPSELAARKVLEIADIIV